MNWLKTFRPNKTAGQESTLDELYGRIGIQAVAAAVRYQSDAKNLAYAPVEPQKDERLEQLAA